MGCKGNAVARSTDGGRTRDAPVNLPGTVGSNLNTWDPAIAVAPDGTVYASFMLSRGGRYYPVADASSDHGATFTQSSSLIPPEPKNWGDRDFSARPGRHNLPDLGLRPGAHLDHLHPHPDGSANDIGWLSLSTDHGARWSAPVQAPQSPGAGCPGLQPGPHRRRKRSAGRSARP